MDYDYDYLGYVKSVLPQKRFNHTLGVIEEAKIYALTYGVDVKKATIAATLHDMAKYMEKEKQEEILIKNYGVDFVKKHEIDVWHGYTAKVLAKEMFNIDDEEILSSIESHTLAKPNMSKLETIIFLADFTDPSRNLEIGRIVHEVALKDLDKAVYLTLKNTIDWLKENNKIINEESIIALDYYRRKTLG